MPESIQDIIYVSIDFDFFVTDAFGEQGVEAQSGRVIGFYLGDDFFKDSHYFLAANIAGTPWILHEDLG